MFFSDGEDNVSEKTLQDLKKITTEKKVNCYVVGISLKDNSQLSKIAKVCNEGRYTTVTQSIALKEFVTREIFESIGYGNFGFYVKDS